MIRFLIIVAIAWAGAAYWVNTGGHYEQLWMALLPMVFIGTVTLLNSD